MTGSSPITSSTLPPQPKNLLDWSICTTKEGQTSTQRWAQLEKLPDFLASKRQLTDRYLQACADLAQVQLFTEPANCESNYWLQTLILDESVADQRDAILEATNDAGLMTRPAWTLMHRLPAYKSFPRAPLPVSESRARRIINLPSNVLVK